MEMEANCGAEKWLLPALLTGVDVLRCWWPLCLGSSPIFLAQRVLTSGPVSVIVDSGVEHASKNDPTLKGRCLDGIQLMTGYWIVH